MKAYHEISCSCSHEDDSEIVKENFNIYEDFVIIFPEYFQNHGQFNFTKSQNQAAYLLIRQVHRLFGKENRINAASIRIIYLKDMKLIRLYILK